MVHESKFKEEQMANALQQPEVGPDAAPSEHNALTADPGNGIVSEEAKRLAQQVRAEQARKKQALNLQRENILSQKTSHPARRAALEDALTQIEGQIAHLG
jgi:3'-phosphoadenosine 5'-phosphosulfate (PAPS) 3'-phosphatase